MPVRILLGHIVHQCRNIVRVCMPTFRFVAYEIIGIGLQGLSDLVRSGMQLKNNLVPLHGIEPLRLARGDIWVG